MSKAIRWLSKKEAESKSSEVVEFSDEEATDECALDQKCNKKPIIIPKNLNTLEALFGQTQRDPNPNPNAVNYEKLIIKQNQLLTSLHDMIKNMKKD